MNKKRAASILISAALAALLAAFLVLLFSGEKERNTSSRALRLNEIMVSNSGAVMDDAGGYPDWIELFNDSVYEADLSGVGLTDDALSGPKFVFPAGTKLAPKGYLIVWCSGDADTPMHAPFKLSAGEDVALFDPSGKLLDSAELISPESGYTLSRQADTLWQPMTPTPGYENNDAGRAAFESGLMEAENMGLYINEFMASNISTVADSFGAHPDWMELYNGNGEDMDISGFGVSDTLAQPMKYRLPEGTVIPAGGFAVIFCSGRSSTDKELHAPFRLKAYGEAVVLSNSAGHILDSFLFANQEADVSMARVPDGSGTFVPCAQPTPGWPNTSEGYAKFSEACRLPLSGVYISEFGGPAGNMPSDWVEICNSTGAAANLKGCGLSDNPKNPAKWTFPDISLDPGEYLTLYAVGETDKTQKKNLKLNFRISSRGQSVFFFGPDGKLLDKLCAGPMGGGVSCGRDASGRRLYYSAPTPGAANGEGFGGITSPPAFSVVPGVYSREQTVALSAGEGEEIRYTLDCTTPHKDSPLYGGPIKVSGNTVIRAAAFKDGFLTGDTVSGTYLFVSDGADHALPIVTLVTDPDNLWADGTGIYAFGPDYDEDAPIARALESAQFYKSKYTTDDDLWSRPACFSFFGEEKRQVFSQNVSIRMGGSFGRSRAQKAFNILAGSEYGPSRMDYEFFPELGYGSYKALVLRAGAQDQNRSKIRDELAVAILKGTDVNFLYQSYRPCVLYLNGEYWGSYFLKEKRNRFFVAQHENTLNTDDMCIGKASTRVTYAMDENGRRMEGGWNDRIPGWMELMEYVKTHDLSSGESYKYVSDRMDVTSFMDYMICELYTGNSDYANIQYYRLPGGKWKWIYYDFCWGFTAADHPTVTKRREPVPAASDLFNALLKNPEWKDAFCRRFAFLLNTAFAPDNVKARIGELEAMVEPEIRREREKFNKPTFMGVKQLGECLGDYDSFLREIEKLRDFADRRPGFIKADLKSSLGLSDSYMKEVFG